MESSCKAQKVLLGCGSPMGRPISQQPKWELCSEAGVSDASSSSQWVTQSSAARPEQCCGNLTIPCTAQGRLLPVLSFWFPLWSQVPNGWTLLYLKPGYFPLLGDLICGSVFTEKKPFLILSIFQYPLYIIICIFFSLISSPNTKCGAVYRGSFISTEVFLFFFHLLLGEQKLGVWSYSQE